MATQDVSFLAKYQVQPPAEDASFLEKYRAQPVAPTAPMRPSPSLGAEATGIGPRRLGMYQESGPLEQRVEDFMNPTAAYKKEHPVLGTLGEGLRNLRETFTPGAMAAGLLSSGPGGPTGDVSVGPRAFRPPVVSEAVPSLRALPTSELPAVKNRLVAQGTPAPTPPERVGPPVEPLQRKPLVERRLGEAGRKPTIESVVNQATGVQPLKPNVPLGQQLESGTAMPEVDPIKAKYPDPEIRQLVRANGERIYQAARGSSETLKAIHDLTRVDLRQALVNSGEDMGQQTVSNSKFAGQGSIPREEAFNRLLDKGLRPEQIVRLAKQVPVKQ